MLKYGMENYDGQYQLVITGWNRAFGHSAGIKSFRIKTFIRFIAFFSCKDLKNNVVGV